MSTEITKNEKLLDVTDDDIKSFKTCYIMKLHVTFFDSIIFI
jgi:hypothetical protein